MSIIESTFLVLVFFILWILLMGASALIAKALRIKIYPDKFFEAERSSWLKW